TTKRADIGAPGRGYGYQWWTYDDGSFTASGIFGQSVFIDPKRKLVIATSRNWPKAVDRQGLRLARDGFFKAVQAAVPAKPGHSVTSPECRVAENSRPPAVVIAVPKGDPC